MFITKKKHHEYIESMKDSHRTHVDELQDKINVRNSFIVDDLDCIKRTLAQLCAQVGAGLPPLAVNVSGGGESTVEDVPVKVRKKKATGYGKNQKIAKAMSVGEPMQFESASKASNIAHVGSKMDGMKFVSRSNEDGTAYVVRIT